MEDIDLAAVLAMSCMRRSLTPISGYKVISLHGFTKQYNFGTIDSYFILPCVVEASYLCIRTC